MSTPIAAIHYPRRFDIDRLLVEACTDLSQRGLKLGGLLQVSTGEPGGCATSVRTFDLRTGDEFNIWEERGMCAEGCRLDERGLAAASGAIDAAIADSADLIVFNRFGRAESLGRGLRERFAAALEAKIPVLTAVRAPYDEAWAQFHGGLGTDLANEPAAIRKWALQIAVPRPAEERTSRSQSPSETCI